MDSPASANAVAGVKSYSLLGRTGLRVSPLCLGAMTFGNTDWGAGEQECRRLFDRYLDAGGNFVDTANSYAGGESERLIGRFLGASSQRDRVVLATKFASTTSRGDPNAGGNGRKNILQAIEASLRRLATDYIDLYWMHVWDGLTPVDEVLETIDGLVRSGKVRYFGLSDVPGWYFGRAQTYSELRGTPKIAAVQLEYSLIDRSIELEHVVAAQELGAGVCVWGPLGSGMLSGKYRRDSEGRVAGDGRIANSDAFKRRIAERNWAIIDQVVDVAKELGRSPAQVALNWITRRPAVCSTIMGATRVEQLEDNLASLDFEIPAELSARLERVSRAPRAHLYNFFDGPLHEAMLGARVSPRPAWDVPWNRASS